MDVLSGVLTKDGDPKFAEPVTGMNYDSDAVTMTRLGGTTLVLPATNISRDPATGRLSFVSDGVNYTVREIREDDGEWLSKYKTLLPLAAVQKLISGDKVEDISQQDESIDAFSMDDSPYILGVVYNNDSGRWSRVDGDWVLMDPNDATFSEMGSIAIDSERTDEFLEFYDNNFVTVQDAEMFEEGNGPHPDEIVGEVVEDSEDPQPVDMPDNK